MFEEKLALIKTQSKTKIVQGTITKQEVSIGGRKAKLKPRNE
jgi:hypothetical protein